MHYPYSLWLIFLALISASPGLATSPLLGDPSNLVATLLDIAVRSSPDQDTPTQNILHPSTSSPSSTSRPHKTNKREVFRAITSGCPTDHPLFGYSACRPHISAQAYRLKCNLAHAASRLQTGKFIYGACEHYELCVEDLRGTQSGQPFAACCVSQLNFRLVQQRQFGGVPAAYYANHVLTPTQREKTDGVSLVATLVRAEDNTTSVFAERMVLEALGATSIVDAVDGPTFYSVVLANGTDDCSDCNSAEISLLPKGTTSIAVAVWLPAAISAAQLYVAIYSR